MSNLRTAAFGDKRGPKQTLIDAIAQVEDAKFLVIAYVDADDQVHTAWSDGSMLARVGLLDVARLQMIDAATE